jgi:hypothetical protein
MSTDKTTYINIKLLKHDPTFNTFFFVLQTQHRTHLLSTFLRLRFCGSVPMCATVLTCSYQ